MSAILIHKIKIGQLPWTESESRNLVFEQLNNTHAVVVEHPNPEQYKNSLFIRTAIDWNHIENSLVIAKNTEEFTKVGTSFSIRRSESFGTLPYHILKSE
jgi:hypothetical protein